MPSLPPLEPALMSVAIAAIVCALELVGWSMLSPRYARLLPSRRPVPDELPVPRGEELVREHRARGEKVIWRWHPGARAVIFRRRLEPRRRPYFMGCLQLRTDGSWSLSWAPTPLFGWPAAVGAWFAVLLVLGWAAVPGCAPIMGVATTLLLLIIAANLHLSLRAF